MNLPIRGSPFIYVADDDDGVRESTIELLKCADIEARGFASARDFLENLDAAAACIVLDLQMPDLSGVQTLEILCRRGNRVPVVLFTGRSDGEPETVAKQFGAIALLAKPVDHDALIGILRRILSEGGSS